MRYKLLGLVLFLEMLVVSAPILRATDLRGSVVGLAGPLVGVGVALFEVKPNKPLRRIRETVTAPDGKYHFTTVHPVNTFCEFAESITRWKCAKRKCKTFQFLHHRVIELTELITHRTINKSNRVGEILANYRRQAQRGWLESGLRLSH